jgi:hypothetical protein
MPKTWDQFIDQEKIEDLRRDVVRIFAALRDMDDRLAYLGQNLVRVETIALRAVREVEDLKVQLSREGGEAGAS